MLFRSLRKALNVIHDSFFLSDTQVLNLFVVGVGHVGSNLLSQIHAQQENLLENKALRLRLVGIANSHTCVFDREGLDTENYQARLAESDIEATPENIRNGVIGMNIFNSVFVDCTASQEIAALYADLLSHNINVVAANKIAASSDYESYIELKRIANRSEEHTSELQSQR